MEYSLWRGKSLIGQVQVTGRKNSHTISGQMERTAALDELGPVMQQRVLRDSKVARLPLLLHSENWTLAYQRCSRRRSYGTRRWHAGFRLHVDEMELHPDYRGPEFVARGKSLAVDGWLTPAIFEMVVRMERQHPQDIKKVWHYLARFGDLFAV